MCTSIGTAGGKDRFPQAQGSQGGEEEPEVSAWARDTETTSLGHKGFSLRGEVFTCWCISGVTSESWSGFTQSSILRGEEWLGVMSSSQDP